MSDGRKLVVDAEAAREIVAMAPRDTWANPVPNKDRWERVIRALTPVSQGGEAVPVTGERDLEWVEALRKITINIRTEVGVGIRAAFEDPRAVEAHVYAEYGDHADAEDREVARKCLAAALAAVLEPKEGR